MRSHSLTLDANFSEPECFYKSKKNEMQDEECWQAHQQPGHYGVQGGVPEGSDGTPQIGPE